MIERNLYKVTQVTQYDDVELHLVVGYFESTEEDAETLGIKRLKVVLKSDGLHVVYGGDSFVFTDTDNDRYHFELCTKELPPPVDVGVLALSDIEKLLNDERYMTTPDDYEPLDWDVTEAFAELKKLWPEKEAFSFSSIAYSVEKVIRNI